MSDLIQIVNGCPPWKPAPDAEIVEVVHRYNIPLLTVLEQAGTRFMARCLVGELGPTSLWIYNRTDEIEAVMLQDGSPEEIDAQADDLSHGSVAVALAMHDEVVFSTRLNVPAELELLDRAGWIAGKLAEATEAANQGSRDLAQELAPSR